ISLLNEIDPVLKFHDFQIVQGSEKTDLIFDVVIPFKYLMSKEELIAKISDKIKDMDEALNPVITVDREYIP
ncbi:MAG: cation-efflux pump, partial [Bacilli bacterium]|nr:cation-efflux pump [Bacilli bacterium]